MTRTVALALLLAAAPAAPAQAPPPGPPPADQGTAAAPADQQKALEAFQAGKLDDAVKLLQAATKGNPTAPPATLVLSRWFFQAQKGREARLMLEKAAADDPAHPAVLLQNGSFALSEGRVTDTVLSCEAALAAAAAGRFGPDDRKRYAREARVGLVAALEARGDPRSLEAARIHLQAVLADDPGNPALLQRTAALEFRLGQPALAQAALARAHKADPTIDPPELVMARLWQQQGDAAKADAAFREAVKGHGTPPPAAATDADKARAATAARVQRAYAEYLLGQGDRPAAAEYLAAAKRIEPDGRDTRALEGLAARYSKDWARAGQIFNDLNHQFPAFGFATANLALVLAESADPAQRKRAIELAQVYLQQNPRSSEAAAVLGYCLFKDGRVDEADRVLGAVLASGQFSADAAYFVALLMENKGKDDEAKKRTRRLLTDVLKAAKGAFVYRSEAEALLSKLGGPLEPEKK